MTFVFENLDTNLRKIMVEEYDLDIKNKVDYKSPRLTESGKENFPRLFKKALQETNEDKLAAEIKSFKCIKSQEERTTRGVTRNVSVPVTANEILAHGEYNRFYMRALCKKILEEKKGTLEVYRARPSENPREESEKIIGSTINPEKLLNYLRLNPEEYWQMQKEEIYKEDIEFKLAKPNSGLSIRIKKA
jgi:flagellar hook-basal body complex protein FliE